MFTTYDYQEKQVCEAIELVSTKRKVCIQLDTGGGKTVEFTFITDRFIHNTDQAVLIIVNRKELLKQAARTIQEVTKIKPYIIDSNTKKFHISRVYIAMVGSLKRRLDLFHNVGLVIIDECHIAEFNKCHDWFLTELIMGFSATPISSNKRLPLNKFYNAISVGPTTKQLISLGKLSQNVTRTPKLVADSTKFAIDKLKGDYDEKQMATEYKAAHHVMNTLRYYRRFCLGEKTIVFNVNIEHSKIVCEAFNLAGYNARHLDSENGSMPSSDPRFEDYREETLYWFKITEDAILMNVMIATTGLDEPTIQRVILNFATLSLVKFKQCSGRSGRMIDEYFIEKYQCEYPYKLEMKNHFEIIDMGANYVRFGDWNEDRDWEYLFNHPPKVYDGVAPVKTCPQCEGLVYASAHICPLKKEDGELCLYEFIKPKTAEEQDLEEMILVTKGIDVDKMIGKYKHKYEFYTFVELAVDVVKGLYETYPEPTLNKKQAAFDRYYQLCIEWWNKTMAGKNGYIQDISESAWHISKARYNFDDLMKKYKPPAKIVYLNEDGKNLHYGRR